MHVVLGWMAAAVTRWPAPVVAALVVATVGFGGLATSNEFEVDMAQLGSDGSEVVAAMDRVRDEFSDPDAAVQVIVDAGPGGDVISARGLAVVAAAEDVALAALGDAARAGDDGRPPTLSLRSGLGAVLTQQGVDPADAGDAELSAALGQALTVAPQLAGLVSDDVDTAAGTARATISVLLLDPDLPEDERTAAAERARDALAAAPLDLPDGVAVSVVSSGLMITGLLDAIRAEVPLLFGAALLVVLSLLVLIYRSLYDVVTGAVGLLFTVIWTFGIVGLLGPNNLGVTGPLTQLAVIVPVLLVGLGIDYSVHLTGRYREQRVAASTPATAAARSLHTVGAALILATAATAIGFGSIATAPMQMLSDFGVAVAIGVACAFVVMGLLVPAARVLRDRRRDRGSGTGTAVPVREIALGRLMGGPIRLAVGHPGLGLGVAGVLVAVSLVAATGLTVEFDRDDFIPDGSEVAAVLDHQDSVFGGGVTETTFVLVDGDLADGDVVAAVRSGQEAVAQVDGVRTVGETMIATDEASALVQVRTTVGDAGADRVRQEVAAAFAPVRSTGADVTVTSEPIIVAEMSDELGAFQMRSIALTLAVVLTLLAGHYGATRRRPMLGLIAMLPAVVSAALVLATMRVLAIPFNVLTATLTAIAVGIGVPYGVHLVNRFVEDHASAATSDDAIAVTLRSTGGALAGSAVTTLGAFVVLAFSGLPPIRSLGTLGAAAIVFALLAGLLVQPGALLLWGRRETRRRSGGTAIDEQPAMEPA